MGRCIWALHVSMQLPNTPIQRWKAERCLSIRRVATFLPLAVIALNASLFGNAALNAIADGCDVLKASIN